MGKLDTLNSLLNEIERRLHLHFDAEGADLVYRVRTKISKLRDENRKLRKNAPSFEGGGGQRENGKTQPALPDDDFTPE